MVKKIARLIKESKTRNEFYKPTFYRLNQIEDQSDLNQLISTTPNIRVFDQINGQLGELVKLRSPKIKFTQDQLEESILELVGDKPIEQYGVWVYYPWSLTLIHILDEPEFIEVRTNRNKYKITDEEAEVLSTKKIGIIGLSVGRSIAVTMATERIIGELRLADFDILELSNYNRIQAPLVDLGVPKIVSAARQIAEIDPFLKVVCYHNGVTEENISDFFTAGGKLDIVLDECDSLDIKIFTRKKAREFGIPVVMDTSDRGMIDVERFDLEPQRPILHGLIDHLDMNNLKGLTNEEKIPYLLPMVGIDTISTRLKASMVEVEQTITTWPQLASSVMLGGAASTNVCRRVLLNEFHDSGRYYLDVESIVLNKEQPTIDHNNPEIRKSITTKEMMQLIKKHPVKKYDEQTKMDIQTLRKIVSAATLAPSGANSQPWQWMYSQNNLYLFFDDLYSAAVLDYEKTTTMISFGTALENLVLKAHELHLEVSIEIPELNESSKLIAVIRFFSQSSPTIEAILEPHICDELVNIIPQRRTNRNLGIREYIKPENYDLLKRQVNTVPGADLHIITDVAKLKVLEEVVGKIDRIRFMHKGGHRDLQAEIRWTEGEAELYKNGIDLINTTDLTPSELAGFQIIKSWPVVKLLNEWSKGTRLEKIGRKSVAGASAVGLITMPNLSCNDYLTGGRAVERMWLSANKLGIEVHPISIPTLLFNVYSNTRKEIFPKTMSREISDLKSKFDKVFDTATDQSQLLLVRFFKADPPKGRSKRYLLEDVLHVANE